MCNAFHEQTKNTKERKLNKRAKFFTVREELYKLGISKKNKDSPPS
jgi:hypothetical protein